MIDQNRSVSKSNQLHVVIFQFLCFFIDLRYILQIPLKRLVIFLKPRALTGYFSNSASSICNYWLKVLPVHCMVGLAKQNLCTYIH
jgi:hypothetical protein